MRTIKFNVYDIYLKQYVCKGISLTDEFMLFGLLEIYIDENPNPNYKHSLQRLNDIVFLQFTGLLDKNGVEIYEGDILYYENESYYLNDNNFNTGLYEVKYCKSAYDGILAFHPINKEGEHVNQHYGNMRNTEAEIIGDIYTNPELC